MQSLVRRLTAVTRQHHQPHHRISLTRPHTHIAEPPHLPNHIPSSSSSSATHHFPSWRSLSTKINSSLSQPIIVQHFSFTSRNYLSTLFSKSLLHRSLLKVHFHRQNFSFKQNFNSYWRSWFYRLSPHDMVVGLIVANVAVFLFWGIADQKFMLNNFTISLDNFKSGRLHTLITNAFSHENTWHLISNMLGLYFFGRNIGRQFGTEFLLKLYLAGAAGGSVFYLVHQAYKAQTSKGWKALIISKEFALGASAAVNAVMLLDIFLYPTATIYLEFFIPVPAAFLGMLLIGKDVLRIIEGDSKISGAAHLGGIAVAAIAWAGIRKGRFY